MGFFDFLSKENRAQGALDRQIKKVLNKHAQSPDRFVALERLRENGSPEALNGLARRFSYVYDKTIEDEQEKEWVAEALISAGEDAIDPVARYMREAETISYPLRVLEKIATPERLLPIIDDLLGREEPGYTRDPTRKLQMLSWLAEWKAAGDEATAKRIVPYLEDFDEGVRFAAVDAVARHRHEPTARAALLAAMLRPEEESRRIKVRIAEALSDAGWTITDRKDEVAKLLAVEPEKNGLPEFGMQHDKLVRKKEK